MFGSRKPGRLGWYFGALSFVWAVATGGVAKAPCGFQRSDWNQPELPDDMKRG
jgi:hypothetical protein